MKRLWVVLILILAFGGLANSLYLSDHEKNGTPLICDVQNLDGCNVVTSSKYSNIFGIPIADFGVLFYSSLFVFAALELVVFDRLLRRILQGFSLVGVLFSLFSTFMQIFVIQALCIYCLVSGAVALLVFFFATRIEPLMRRDPQVLPVPIRVTDPTKDSLPMPPA